MRTRDPRRLSLRILNLALLLGLLSGQSLIAGGKIGIYGIRMDPEGRDALTESRSGWGCGIHAVAPISRSWDFLAGVLGVEGVNLLSEATTMRDPISGLNIRRDTDQNYYRVYVGGQLGGHGNGFLRPHLGASLALILNSITTELDIPNRNNPLQDLHQKLSQETKTHLGYDFSAGLDLNFSNTFCLDGGVRYLRSFSEPQQLDNRSIKVCRYYFQAYFGIGMSFEMIRRGCGH